MFMFKFLFFFLMELDFTGGMRSVWQGRRGDVSQRDTVWGCFTRRGGWREQEVSLAEQCGAVARERGGQLGNEKCGGCLRLRLRLSLRV